MQPFHLKPALVAVILMAGTAMAAAQPVPAAGPELAERRDTLRRTWQRDGAIRDAVGLGAADRPDASSDFHAEDYIARQSLAAEPPAVGADRATITTREARP